MDIQQLSSALKSIDAWPVKDLLPIRSFNNPLQQCIEAGYTEKGTYAAVWSGTELLESYERGCKGKVIEIRERALMFHAIKPSCIKIETGNIRSLCLYLLDVGSDIFKSMPIQLDHTKALETLMAFYESPSKEKEFIQGMRSASFQFPVELALDPEGVTYAARIFEKMRGIDKAGMSDVFYSRGTRTWAAFSRSGSTFSAFFSS